MDGASTAPTSPDPDRAARPSAPLIGADHLEVWRAMVRPFPGSVPPFAGFDPIAIADPTPDGDVVGASITSALAAIGSLCAVDPSCVDPAALAQLVEGVEQIRRVADAAATRAAGAIDARNPFRTHGYFTAKTFLKQRCQLSGPEAYRRVQTARMRSRLPEWSAAARAGTVGVAQSEAMGRVAANPRIEPAVLTRDAGMLLDDAINLPFAEFEHNLRTWEALADPMGDDARSERSRQRREFNLVPRPDGGWNLSGFLPEPSGVEFAEIFAWYVDAEWRLDWADARNWPRRRGDGRRPRTHGGTAPSRRPTRNGSGLCQ